MLVAAQALLQHRAVVEAHVAGVAAVDLKGVVDVAFAAGGHGLQLVGQGTFHHAPQHKLARFDGRGQGVQHRFQGGNIALGLGQGAAAPGQEGVDGRLALHIALGLILVPKKLLSTLYIHGKGLAFLDGLQALSVYGSQGRDGKGKGRFALHFVRWRARLPMYAFDGRPGRLGIRKCVEAQLFEGVRDGYTKA